MQKLIKKLANKYGLKYNENKGNVIVKFKDGTIKELNKPFIFKTINKKEKIHMRNIDKIRLYLQKELEDNIKHILENECPFHYNLKGFEDDNDERCYDNNKDKESCKKCWELEIVE